MFPGTDHGELRRIALRQLGVVHRDQFRVLDVSRNYVVSPISARRWTAVGRTGVRRQHRPPLRMQLMGLAGLDAVTMWPSAVTHPSSWQGSRAFHVNVTR